MTNVVRALTRIQDQDDFDGPLSNGQFLQWDNTSETFKLSAVNVNLIESDSTSPTVTIVQDGEGDWLRFDRTSGGNTSNFRWFYDSDNDEWVGQTEGTPDTDIHFKPSGGDVSLSTRLNISQSSNTVEGLSVSYTGSGRLAALISGGDFDVAGGSACITSTGNLHLFGLGSPDAADKETITLGWNSTDSVYELKTTADGTGSYRSIRIPSGDASVVPVTVQGLAAQSANLQEWQDSDGVVLAHVDATGGIRTASTITTALTEGSVVFANSLSILAENNANLFWDDTNNRLGIGTNSPEKEFHLEGDAKLVSNTLDESSKVGFSWQGTVNGNINSTKVVQAIIDGNAQNGTGHSALSGVALNVQSGGVFVGVTGLGSDNTVNLRQYVGVSGGATTGNGIHAGTKLLGGGFSAGSNFDGGLEVIGVKGSARQGATSSFGGFFSIGSTSVGVTPFAGVAGLGVSAGTATSVGAIIRGAASQSANLQEWQNDIGTALTYIESSGRIRAANGIKLTGTQGRIIENSGGLLLEMLASTGPWITSTNSGVINFTARGNSHATFVGTESHNTLIGSANINSAGPPVHETAAGLVKFIHKLNPCLQIDSDGDAAGNTRLLLYDVDTATLQRVKVGANGTGPGGTGRALYIDDA